MSILLQEYDNLLNPAFGAILLYSFADGFCEIEHKNIPLPLCYFPLPIVTIEQVADLIVRTNKSSGLRKFATKMSDEKMTDLLLSLQDRVQDFLELSHESIRLGSSAKLYSLDISEASLKLHDVSIPKDKIPISQKGLLDAAWRFGYWCSDLDLSDVCSTLRIRL